MADETRIERRPGPGASISTRTIRPEWVTRYGRPPEAGEQLRIWLKIAIGDDEQIEYEAEQRA